MFEDLGIGLFQFSRSVNCFPHTVVSATSTDIDDIIIEAKVFPNPTQSFLQIESGHNWQTVRLEFRILNNQGQLQYLVKVPAREIIKFDLPNLAAGNYIFELRGNDEFVAGQLVIVWN